VKRLTVTIAPRAPFGTPPKGDSLFGQLCWAARNRYGEARLVTLLDGYTGGRPFAVIGDFLPHGYWPLPSIPLHSFRSPPDAEPKQLRKRRWLSTETLQKPVTQWLAEALTDERITSAASALENIHPQPHNSIDRRTGTTGSDMFAPYTAEQLWYAQDLEFDCHVVYDEARISESDIMTLFDDTGAVGFGRDASIGLGKFCVNRTAPMAEVMPEGANAYLTLAPCAPQGLGLDAEHCFYIPFTRFGRHGDIAVQFGNPFKAPVLLAETAALLTPHEAPRAAFIGQGLGGDGSVSSVIAGTVHQGYCPVVGIRADVAGDQVP